MSHEINSNQKKSLSLVIEDDLENEDDLKKEDDLKNEDDLKTVY